MMRPVKDRLTGIESNEQTAPERRHDLNAGDINRIADLAD